MIGSLLEAGGLVTCAVPGVDVFTCGGALLAGLTISSYENLTSKKTAGQKAAVELGDLIFAVPGGVDVGLGLKGIESLGVKNLATGTGGERDGI